MGKSDGSDANKYFFKSCPGLYRIWPDFSQNVVNGWNPILLPVHCLEVYQDNTWTHTYNCVTQSRYFSWKLCQSVSDIKPEWLTEWCRILDRTRLLLASSKFAVGQKRKSTLFLFQWSWCCWARFWLPFKPPLTHVLPPPFWASLVFSLHRSRSSPVFFFLFPSPNPSSLYSLPRWVMSCQNNGLLCFIELPMSRYPPFLIQYSAPPTPPHPHPLHSTC